MNIFIECLNFSFLYLLFYFFTFWLLFFIIYGSYPFFHIVYIIHFDDSSILFFSSFNASSVGNSWIFYYIYFDGIPHGRFAQILSNSSFCRFIAAQGVRTYHEDFFGNYIITENFFMRNSKYISRVILHYVFQLYFN